MSHTDPDMDDQVYYDVVGGDSGVFTILSSSTQDLKNGEIRKTGALLDFETKDTYTIKVQARDSGGLKSAPVDVHIHVSGNNVITRMHTRTFFHLPHRTDHGLQ